jgi:hypothetical protein
MTAHIPGSVKDSSIKSDEDKLVLITIRDTKCLNPLSEIFLIQKGA